MPGIVWLLIALPPAALVGAWTGIAAARSDVKELRSIPMLILFFAGIMALVGRKHQLETVIRGAVRVDVPELPANAKPERGIMSLDTASGLESLWCHYPWEAASSAVDELNSYYAPLKLFWLEGDERPDLAEARRAELERQREGARYITRPLTRRGIPIYRNNTRPAEIVAVAPDRASALKLQAEYALRGVSTTVPGEGVY